MIDNMQTTDVALLQILMDKAYEEGDLKQALAFAKLIYQYEPSYNAYFDYALIAKELSLFKHALSAIEQALLIDPQLPEAYIEKALLLYELEDLQGAYDYLLSLRHILLDHTPWALLAVLCAELSHLDEASFYAAKAISHSPDAWSYHARAIVYQMRKEYDKASIDFQTALTLDSQNPELWNSYALFFEELLAFEHALEVYNTAIDRFQLEYSFLYLNRAKVHHLLDHKDLAIIDCELALAQANNNGDIWFLLASLLHEDGNLFGALHAYNQSLRYIKKDPSIHFCKAQLLDELGDFKQAKSSYEKALRFAPENQDIRIAYANFMLRYNFMMHHHTGFIPHTHPNQDDQSLHP
ncbi:tetratricopeptide repeat protein [Entomospira culicis]|uniref:Tetratricopeptide repeat protein n=1 Tax=Entomospira culicis TaxID=2719989 RepID=A0A968GLE0_9SPIO|nr:tetratricopeptide repeat protein [Entomospira culicis]NIZ19726.1 tetratricopeptide repeat protein [Entomospira culicis]NIZ69940.1 tetratricopeptide repeat protein [Entomospira culicis]WDI37045.1 tetratricopeptide repeat protein [Entomospira culicis]WDI38674.1 tetratricopeptide repeat protein [Entomospira culicis]